MILTFVGLLCVVVALETHSVHRVQTGLPVSSEERKQVIKTAGLLILDLSQYRRGHAKNNVFRFYISGVLLIS